MIKKRLSAKPLPSAKPRRSAKPLVIAAGSIIGVIAVGLVAVLAVGGLFVPAKYLEPWERTYADQFSDSRVQLVAQGLLAPSSHNMQPWVIRLDPADASAMYLYADSTRLTEAVDPLARQTMVSQGTFLTYLQVAGEERGYGVAFDLFPSGDYDENALAKSMDSLPVAKITIEADGSADDSADAAAEPADFGALFLSDTNRDPYTATRVSAAQESDLAAVAAASPASWQFFDGPADTAALGEFGRAGTRIETEYAPSTAEGDRLFYANETAKNTARSGFAVEGQGTTGFMKYFLQGAITLLPAMNDHATAATRAIASTEAAVTSTPAYGMISTAGNTRLEQVQAGMLYSGVSLRARTLGLVMQPLSQVLQEYPTMADEYAAIHREYAAAGETIQMVVRIGSATSEYPPTMRRDAMDFVVAKQVAN